MIRETFSHAMRPYPDEISQIARHGVLYEGALHVTSPYPVAAEETTVVYADPPPAEEVEDKRASASPLINASPTEGALAAPGSVKWGPYSDLGAWSRSEETLLVRWIRDKPLVYSDRVVREVTVYPWTGVSERLDFRVSNGGAKMRGSFSRFHHLQGGFVKAINDFNVVLPREAADVYYRDEIGNISTSSVSRDTAVPSQNLLPQGFGGLEGTVLNAVPRYPLLGGWKATFELGYTVPWGSQVQRLSGGRHRLTTLYGSPLFPVTVGELELRIVLPEGARNPRLSLPHGLTGVEVSEDTKVTWFDVHGRPVVVLRGKDLIEDHRVPLTVEFEYSMLWMLKGLESFVPLGHRHGEVSEHPRGLLERLPPPPRLVLHQGEVRAGQPPGQVDGRQGGQDHQGLLEHPEHAVLELNREGDAVVLNEVLPAQHHHGPAVHVEPSHLRVLRHLHARNPRLSLPHGL